MSRARIRVCLLLLAVAIPMAAQNSGIQGVVTDPSGAPVPDASITITNVATGVVTTVKTNEQGFYTAPFLPQGNYRIEANKAGFARMSREKLVLDVWQVARVDFELKLVRLCYKLNNSW